MNEKITTSLVPYKFEYAMSRLKDAIDYAVQTGEFEGVRLWAMNVEESHNAEVADMKEEVKNLDEGAKMLYTLATKGEEKLLQDWQLNAIAEEADAKDWQDQTTQLRNGG